VSELRFYNQLHKRKQPFRSIDPGRVRIYSCGPTVYSRQHLGNMRPYVFADVLCRTLEQFGDTVRHVINITDVGHLTSDADAGEDKMEAAAREQCEDVWAVARRYTELFQCDLERLGVRAPAVWCRATDHIAEQIEMIRSLEARGYAYRLSDGIYFDVSRFPRYAEFAGADLSAQSAQQRIGSAAQKRSAADFGLWKFSPPDGPRRQMEWESPWGRGFPGWHIECSAMSAVHLGVPFDIHTGGADHIPVHHTNEIAQTESATGVAPCVGYWIHNGWLMLQGAKISKSAGHTVNLDDLIAQGYEPLAYRYFLLSAHYRQQMNFTEEAMAAAQTALRRLRRHAQTLCGAEDSTGAEQLESYRERFRAALADDLNTPQALAVLWDALRGEQLGSVEKLALLREWDRVLAIEPEAGTGAVTVRADSAVGGATDDDASRIEALIRERLEARTAREFGRADQIRDALKSEGITLEDGPQGTSWRRG